MIISEKLTGNIRHRSARLTRNMILQVEMEQVDETYGALYPRHKTYKVWRDATTEDVQALYKMGVLK